jgi:hypothetical protein
VAYSDFTIDDVKTRFHLRFDEDQDYFASAAPVTISPLLRDTLAESIPLALAINTEKARSELIIAPVLMEARRQAGRRTSLFSGVDFNVDPEQGLKGTCDFLLGLSPEQLTIEAPVLAVVEAKNENLKTGIGQCIAEVFAARLFNQQRGKELPVYFGIVTTGNNWRFLRLIGDRVYIDRTEHYISDVGRVVGVITSMLQANPTD